MKQINPGRGLLSTLLSGAMAVWTGVTLVANGLEGGAALDTLAGNGNLRSSDPAPWAAS